MLAPMRTSAALFALASVLAIGCQSGAEPPRKVASGTPLAKDLATICNAVERSGAAKLEPADQAYTMAQWLPTNVGDEGRQWLISFAKLGDDRRARHDMLERDARSAGILDCPLLAQW